MDIKMGFDSLKDKLSDFKKKYYLNELRRGALLSIVICGMGTLLVAVPEYFSYFSQPVRAGLFYGLLACFGFTLVKYCLIPAYKLVNLDKGLSDIEASNLLNKHFPEIGDGIINTIQLKEQLGLEGVSASLLEASISQKSSQLNPIPFLQAIDKKKTRKVLPFALIPIAIITGILLIQPAILVESTDRIVHYGKQYSKPAPFVFTILNQKLQSIKGEDFTLNIKTTGKEIPQEVYINFQGGLYKLIKDGKNKFHYTFNNLQDNTDFFLASGEFTSPGYTLNVYPKPFIKNFEVELIYPPYIGKKSEVLQNTGDLTVPEGSRIKWKFYADYTEDLQMYFGNKKVSADRLGQNLFTYSNIFNSDDNYFIKIKNNYLNNNDTIQYKVSTIPDVAPSITVEEEKDSARLKNFYFTGSLSDDYGFSGLKMVYQFTKTTDSAKSVKRLFSIPIGIQNNRTQQSFYFNWDAYPINILAGEELEYFFVVSDNDGIHGPKSTKSQKFIFKAPTEKQLKENSEKQFSDASSKMQSALKMAKSLQKDLDEAKKRLTEKKGNNLDFQDKKFIEDILKKQTELESSVKEIQKETKENIQNKEEFSKENQDLLEKQRQVAAMMDQILDPETKKLIDELKKMMDENMKDQIQDQLDKIKVDNKDIAKELDRMQEMLKQTAFDEKVENTTQKIDDLVKKQEELTKQSEDKKSDAKELSKKQDELAKQTEEVKKDLESLEKQNEELEEKHDLGDLKKNAEDAQSQQQKASKSLAKNNKKEAKEEQEKAQESLKKAKEGLESMQEKEEDDKNALNYAQLRQILENLLYTSFEQERVIGDLKVKPNYSPEYVEIAQRQKKLKGDAKMIEDSILSLSKKVPEMSAIVNREISDINFNMDNTIKMLGERNTPQARSYGQYTMTSVNNLAVLLSEVLDQLKQKANQSESKKTGKKKGKPNPNCKNPGSAQSNKPGKKGNKPGMGNLRKMQESLSKQLQEMKSGGKKMQGNNGGMGGSQASEQLAKMAAQQEAIRRELQKINAQQNKSGNHPLGNLDDIQKQMDKNEEDIVNKRITEQTIQRHQEIVTRLLESEKAEKKQGEDDKRESNAADQKMLTPPPALVKYKAMKDRESEILKTLLPALNNYYRLKVKQYFEGLRN
jgi:hypothetical protein